MGLIWNKHNIQNYWMQYRRWILSLRWDAINCPYLPSKHREDWGLEDPIGKGDEEFKKVIALIVEKIKMLREKLGAY